MTASHAYVAVFMATDNGAEYLPEQLYSLASPTHENCRLWVSDDGSTEATLDILRRYQQVWGPDKLRLLFMPHRGFQPNFLTLMHIPAGTDRLASKIRRTLETLIALTVEQPFSTLDAFPGILLLSPERHRAGGRMAGGVVRKNLEARQAMTLGGF